MNIDFIVYISGFITVYIFGLCYLYKIAHEIEEKLIAVSMLIVVALFSWIGCLFVFGVYILQRRSK